MSDIFGYSVSLCLIAGAAFMPLPGHAQIKSEGPPLTLKSVSVDMPAGERAFAAGPGADAINGNCLTCHSAGMVLNQPAMSKTAWEGEVRKMINVYKAPVAAEDVPTIVAYLDHIKGAR